MRTFKNVVLALFGEGRPLRLASRMSIVSAVFGLTNSKTRAICSSAHPIVSCASLARFIDRVTTLVRWSSARSPGQGSFSCFGLMLTCLVRAFCFRAFKVALLPRHHATRIVLV